MAPGTSFMADSFFPQTEGGDGSGMIQEHYIYCTLDFYYYISSTSDYQALGPGGWGTPALQHEMPEIKVVIFYKNIIKYFLFLINGVQPVF